MQLFLKGLDSDLASALGLTLCGIAKAAWNSKIETETARTQNTIIIPAPGHREVCVFCNCWIGSRQVEKREITIPDEKARQTAADGPGELSHGVF
jgi:hypothetical protein